MAWNTRARNLLFIQTLLPIFLAGGDLTIDHVTVAGARLKDLQTALAAVGIGADYGGAHSNRATEMAIVSFPDGSYLELIALQADADAKMVAAATPTTATAMARMTSDDFMTTPFGWC